MFYYTAYGLGIASSIELPELEPSTICCDVAVHHGTLDHLHSKSKRDKSAPIYNDQCQADTEAHYVWATAEEAVLHWDQVGTFYVRGGREIIIDPASDANAQQVRLYLLGPALAVLLHQRGFLVLHASAISINGEAVAFAGNSGWGKSTMARAMHARGHEFVADDVVPVYFDGENRPFIFSGIPQFKLWPEAAAFLGDSPASLPRLLPEFEKRARRVTTGTDVLKPLPLRALYMLGGGDKLQISHILPREAFQQIIAHTYTTKILTLTNGSAHHFFQCALLAREHSLVYRLDRRHDLQELPDVAELIEKHVRLFTQEAKRLRAEE
jgi:hypothetical protein